MTDKRLLVVDDHEMNQRLMTALLTTHDYEVRSAADAEEARSLVRSFRPLLILMDVQLPGLDGLSLTRELKGDPATAHILVVAVTADSVRRDEGRALAAGCDAYVLKPIDIVELPRMIARLLDPPPAEGTR